MTQLYENVKPIKYPPIRKFYTERFFPMNSSEEFDVLQSIASIMRDLEYTDLYNYLIDNSHVAMKNLTPSWETGRIIYNMPKYFTFDEEYTNIWGFKRTKKQWWIVTTDEGSFILDSKPTRLIYGDELGYIEATNTPYEIPEYVTKAVHITDGTVYNEKDQLEGYSWKLYKRG